MLELEKVKVALSKQQIKFLKENHIEKIELVNTTKTNFNGWEWEEMTYTTTGGIMTKTSSSSATYKTLTSDNLLAYLKEL
jgi:hypothetical protein